MAAHNVWLAKYDSSDIVLADEVAGVSRDYNGNITVHMSGVRGTAVTLVSPGPEGGPPTPEDFHRRLLAQGIKAGEFRRIDPVLFYTSLIGACDHLFFSRHAMSRATGVGPVTDEVCRDYIQHMEALICGGMLKSSNGAAAG